MITRLIAFFVLVAAGLVFGATPAMAGVFTVPDDQATVQEAIDEAADGDEVVLKTGTYQENIHLKGKNITLRSVDPEDPEIVKATVLDGGKQGSVITLAGSEGEHCVIAGISVVHGATSGEEGRGGGIRGNDAMATIRYCAIPTNTAYSEGGGIVDLHGLIERNILSGNTTGEGFKKGGAFANCDGTISRNRVFNNHATGKGGAFFECHGVIKNNLIYDNTAGEDTGEGGGFHDCQADILNNVIFHNVAMDNGGGLSECTGTIANNILWGNSAWSEGPHFFKSAAPTHCCIEYWYGGGKGNMAEDPLFMDAEAGDFRLREGSPCLDVGLELEEVSEAFDGVKRPQGGGFDIGAFER